jgi:hypothetical protein
VDGDNRDAGIERGNDHRAVRVPCSPCRRTTPSAQPAHKSQTAAIAIVSGLAVIGVAAGVWFVMQRGLDGRTHARRGRFATMADNARGGVQPPPKAARAAVVAETAESDPGRSIDFGRGSARPERPALSNRQGVAQSDLRADSKSQLVEKAADAFARSQSLSKNYDVLKAKRSCRTAAITSRRRSARARRKSARTALMSMTTQAIVKREGRTEVAQSDVARRTQSTSFARTATRRSPIRILARDCRGARCARRCLRRSPKIC